MIDNLLKKIRKDRVSKRNLDDMLKASNLSNEEKFSNILKFAKKILRNTSVKSIEHPIFDFIRILGRGIQSDYMKYVIYYDCEGGDHGVPQLEWWNVGFDIRKKFIGDNEELIQLEDMKKEIKSNKKINLSKDLILPWPWNRNRLFNTITNIGKGRSWGEWRQDYNHDIEVWLPLGIAWIWGGNHSITIGVIQGGEITPNTYYDISDMYKHIKCDGKNYIRTKTNWLIKEEIIAPVKSVEFAAIFELGRLLKENNISFID